MADFLKNTFRKSSITTIVNVYLLILAGGVVRCTGSGMGCPDWPKCFGKWIPPTELSELPVNFVELYSDNGHLSVDFNVYKTWTEYINRLLGVLVGFSVFFTFIFSIGFWKSNKRIVYYSLASFILVGLEGWIGAKVVASNLKPLIISIHMLLALIIVGLLLKALAVQSIYAKNNDDKLLAYPKLKNVTVTVCIVVLLQILIGTQVRQAIDLQVIMGSDKSMWIRNLGLEFNIHIIFAYIVLFSVGFLVFQLHKFRYQTFVMWSLLICVLTEYLGGLVMYKFDLPSFMEPIHLFCASFLFGFSFYLYSLLSVREKLDSKELVTE